MLNTELVPATSNRVLRATAVRSETTVADAFVPAPAQVDNGDEARYPDNAGTYSIRCPAKRYRHSRPSRLQNVQKRKNDAVKLQPA